MQLSVVIPCLNEAAALPRLLAQLQAQRGVELQIIVADGGSGDGSADIAGEAGASVVLSQPGRGRQMNAGARVAMTDWLLFLHAGSSLPHEHLLRDALAAIGAAGPRTAGHFALEFERSEPGHDFFYRYLEGKTRLNRAHTISGDQGLLISAAWLRELGGFDERLPFLEDQRIAAKIFAQGRWLLLPGHLRRSEAEGLGARHSLMALLLGLHAAGAREFFEQAPQVYASQQRSARLDVAPYYRLAREAVHQRGPLRSFWRAAKFGRENAWQAFYWLDLKRGGDGRWLRFHDRVAAPLLNNPVGRSIVMLAMAGWFYLRLPRQLK